MAGITAAATLPHSRPLPALALGSTWILDAFRAIVLFYAFLLIFVPLVRAARGDLPIELSLRGARWEEADAASGALRALDRHVASLAREMQDLGELVGEALGRIAAVEDSVAPPRPDGRS